MNDFKSRVEKIVSESEDIVTALEAIGPMYGIPSTNMLEDATIKSIKVVDDHIIAPSGVKPTTQPIMCAIGAVLDHISQRVDSKLTRYQSDVIAKNKLEEHIRRDANPAKGTVIGRHEDSNGDEILVYDSGLVDMANTKEAQQKVAELRSQGTIPKYTPKPFTSSKSTYFTADDDISVPEPPSDIFDEKQKVSMAEVTNESAQIIDWIAHYNDTTHLGYDMLQEQGFDYIKPIDSIVMESNSPKKEIKLEDIKHMKFDNTHILKAVKYLNQARATLPPGKGNWSFKSMIDTKEYQMAIKELEAQFDCHISLKWLRHDQLDDNLFTSIVSPDYMIYSKITVSKSKGFQLHGLPIEIFVYNDMIDAEMTKNTNESLFGQFVCSGLCHEIFHNIAAALRYQNSVFQYTLTSTLSLAVATPNAKTRRIIIEKFMKSLKGQGVKLNALQQKRLTQQLCYLTAVANNKKILSDIKGKLDPVVENGAANKQMDEYIRILKSWDNAYKSAEKRHARVKKHPVLYGILYGIGLLLTLTMIGSIIGIPLMLLTVDPLGKEHDDYMKSVNKEEYYCDLFAGMYSLPVTFTYGYSKRDFSANNMSKDRLDRIVELERRVGEFIHSSYPTMSERNYAGITIAKTLLDGKDKLDPAIREYCEWIVANYSSLLDTNINEKYSTVTFNPEEARDLDEHVQNLIDNNDITITESYQM